MTLIRIAEPADGEAIAAIYAPHVRHGFVSFETDAPDGDEIRRRMAASEGLYPWLAAIQEGGGLIGYAYAGRFRERAAYRFVVETTIYVDPAAHRQGVGRRLYGTLLEMVAAQGFFQAIGVVALPNPASVRLHEELGFVAAGTYRSVGYKQRTWIDVGIWQRELNAPDASPAEPRPFAQVSVGRDRTAGSASK